MPKHYPFFQTEKRLSERWSLLLTGHVVRDGVYFNYGKSLYNPSLTIFYVNIHRFSICFIKKR